MNNRDFDFKRVAQGYKKRPFLHKQVIEQFKRDVTDKTFSYGLDVGCGAGLSSKALKMICSHVTGTDISKEMIEVAKEVCEDEKGYDFIVSRAEETPVLDKKFDIVTAAGVISWVEKEPFLRNLRSIINEQGYVLIYDFGISDRMKGNEAYTSWWHDAYLKEFPKPFRNEDVWTKEDIAPYGFHMLDQIRFDMEYEFDSASFIEFMMIQSNVNAMIEGKGRSIEEVREWFLQSAAPLFNEEKKTLIFSGYSWYMFHIAKFPPLSH